MSKFKIGDTVEVVAAQDMEFSGLKGKVVWFEDTTFSKFIGVDFGEATALTHDLNGRLSTDTGWFFEEYELELLESSTNWSPAKKLSVGYVKPVSHADEALRNQGRLK